jgi:hypothetical protein
MHGSAFIGHGYTYKARDNLLYQFCQYIISIMVFLERLGNGVLVKLYWQGIA